MKIISWKVKSYQPNNILISSFAIAKNIQQCKSDSETNKSTKISIYFHSPMQYIRSHYDEYTHKLKGLKLLSFKFITPYLRKRDLKYNKYDEVFSNSIYTAEEVQKLYKINSIIKYPLINKLFFESEIETNPLDYYIYIGRLVNFVRETDTIIRLFNHLNKPLIIMGSGPDELYLKSIAKSNIIFIGRINDINEKIKLIKQSLGLINITKESFGLSTAESLLLGVPVFGYNQGATPELVDKNSGTLIDNKSIHHMLNKFKEFENTKRDRNIISQKAKKIF